MANVSIMLCLLNVCQSEFQERGWGEAKVIKSGGQGRERE